MSDALTPEASDRFGAALMAELGVDTGRVRGGSVSVEVYDDSARVTWEGIGILPAETVQRLLAESQRLAADWRPLDEKDSSPHT